jgi:cytochrome P450
MAALANHPVKEGTTVVVPHFGAPNREHGDEIQVEDGRVVSHRHATFGHGRHHCLGVHMARLGLRVAIGEWLRAIATFEVEPGFTPSLVAWEAERLAALPLRWGV